MQVHLKIKKVVEHRKSYVVDLNMKKVVVHRESYLVIYNIL